MGDVTELPVNDEKRKAMAESLRSVANLLLEGSFKGELCKIVAESVLWLRKLADGQDGGGEVKDEKEAE